LEQRKPLWDCFCGSGTIPIEAALIGRNIAPGLNRTFASEEWPAIGKDIWKQERALALRAIDHDIKLKIYGSDINPDAIELAKKTPVSQESMIVLNSSSVISEMLT